MQAEETFKGRKKNARDKYIAPMYRAYGNNGSNASDLSGVSDANETKKAKMKPGKVNIDELITEMRHKYLTILKSCYWEFFEEGQCASESVIVLMESADRALDHEHTPIQDWNFIESYIISDSYIKVLSAMSQLPLVGKFFRQMLFDHFSLSYDIIVNFIEGHEMAQKNIMMVIESKEFVSKIIDESSKMLRKSEEYMFSHIEDMFPEICKAIQHRRASYYLLVHEYHHIEKMVKHGQIEEKEANELKGQIDEKIYYLQMHPPEIQLIDQNSRIVHYSELSEIFSRDELQQAIKSAKFEERIFNKGERILQQGELANKILYVARGTVVEKDGELEDQVPQIKHKRGMIVCLQNLVPNSEKEEQISDVYCYGSSIASVFALELDHLKHLLLEDDEKMLKLWKVISHRLIVINHEKLPQFSHLRREKIQQVCKMCDFRIYKPGDVVDLATGGVILRGGVAPLNEDVNEMEKKLNTVDRNAPVNVSHSVSYQASQKVIQKRNTLREMGEMAKKMGLAQNHRVHIGESSVKFVNPDPRYKSFVAKSEDYVIIMHFSEILSQVIGGSNFSEDNIDSAFRDFQYENFRRKNTLKTLNFPSQIQNVKSNMTFKEQSSKTNRIEMSIFNQEKKLPVNVERALKKMPTLGGSQSMHPIRQNTRGRKGSNPEIKADASELMAISKVAETQKSSARDSLIKAVNSGDNAHINNILEGIQVIEEEEVHDAEYTGRKENKAAGTGGIVTQPNVKVITDEDDNTSEMPEVENEGINKVKFSN
uniref:Cyclic nucleotide-binding domain-containing protein n=1 Tax=Strombidium rassoulzadegani TaxID=1082188 RepID=A0A7S3CTS7_9SPIT|mmetsp:Transcript_5431/g.9148  ORF Transcript_5431/g.9148 Transcript_5431/m.9148 type:complete len:768 (+) Transcript_5431:2014-4317(+)